MNIGFLELLCIRGLESMVADACLNQSIDDVLVRQDALDNYFNSRYIAEQLFFQLKGWGL